MKDLKWLNADAAQPASPTWGLVIKDPRMVRQAQSRPSTPTTLQARNGGRQRAAPDPLFVTPHRAALVKTLK